jgi:trigger factor
MNEPEAIARIKRTLALAEVAKLENLEAAKEDADKRAAEILQSLTDEEVDPAKLNQVVMDEIITEKAVEFLKQNAQIEFVPEGSLASAPEIAEDADALDVES